jgi:hypothetical protein
MFIMWIPNVKTLSILPMICVAAVSIAVAQQTGAVAEASAAPAPLFLTATNGITNYLAVINTRTKQTTYVATGGNGGASGNAGGVAVEGKIAAVVNFGSGNVTIFTRRGDTMQPTQMIATASQPVSVAFGSGHLVVLGLTTAQSFPVYGNTIQTAADGQISLLLADKSAAQIVTFNGGVAYTEKTGSVAEVSLSTEGAPGLGTTNQAVMLPAAPNNNTPFGLIGRGNNIYLTIAHSDLETLVVNGQIVSTAMGPTPFTNAAGSIIHAPCWNALSGQFLYASDSPGGQLLRYLVSDTNIFFDKAGVATLAGPPTDLTVDGGMLAVIDGGNGTVSNASLFDIDAEGELTLRFAVKIAGPINGAAIID